MDKDSKEWDYTYIESTLGWGGMIVGPDGIGMPLPEHEALTAAIPLWVNIPEHLDSAVSIYVDVMSRPEVGVRLAAISAIGDIVRKYGRLPHEAQARRAISIAQNDTNPEVAAAAVATSSIVDKVLG